MRILDPHDNVLLCESTSLAAGLTYILSTKQGWDPALDSWVTHLSRSQPIDTDPDSPRWFYVYPIAFCQFPKCVPFLNHLVLSTVNLQAGS